MVKRKKHPDAPKAALSPYMWFCQEKRITVKEEIPEISAKEILRELGTRWRALDDEDKKDYEALSLKDKERFEEEKTEFLKTHSSLYIEVEDSKKRKKKPKKDPNAPKKPRSAYLLFVSKKRKEMLDNNELEGLKQTEIMKKVAMLWKELNVTDKERFYEEAYKEKAAYTEAYQNYQESLKAKEEDSEISD